MLEIIRGGSKIEERAQGEVAYLTFPELLHAHECAWQPPPPGIGRCVRWVAEGLLARFGGFDCRSDGYERWPLAASCLALLLEVVHGYEPARCEAQEGALSEGATPAELAQWLRCDAPARFAADAQPAARAVALRCTSC